MENLIDVLERESAAYEGLLELSMKKSPVIVKGDLARLQEITDEEQEIVGRIQRMDGQRGMITADIANVLNKDVDTLKLSALIQMLEARPKEQKLLASVNDRLQVAVDRLKRTNEQNRELLENALELVEFDMNVLRAMRHGPETANYNKGAYSAGTIMTTDSGSFDAKQ
jgi:flagellar biosynthesis/type III secretory pathway chaperone